VVTATCASCGAITLPHRACKNCGKYGDRSVKKTGMEEVKKVLKKETKAPKAKATKKTAE
jgi:ribosomal protein L32